MPLTGSNLAYFSKNINFTGFNQNVKVSQGDISISYVILDTDSTGSQLYQTYMVDLTSQRLHFAGRSISFPGGSPPSSDSVCWFDKNAICTGGQSVSFVLYFSLFFQIIMFSVFIFRCWDHLHHSDLCCHIHFGHWRDHYKSFHQVRPETLYDLSGGGTTTNKQINKQKNAHSGVILSGWTEVLIAM